MREILTGLLLITFVPMIVAAVFVILTFVRMGYGRIGKWLSIGFSVLIISLILGTINSLIGFGLETQVVIGITRVIGWSAIATGFVNLYIETDRSIP